MKPISRTAFYCCGVRMLDAELAKPVCGDSYAKFFMNDDGLQILERFKEDTRPNASNVARHRLIDDLIREQLVEDPNLTIVIIGAGFDTRAFRLNGGRWVELDEPQVIEYKNEQLPVSQCENELQRIAIDFATESLEEKLSGFTDRTPVLVVIEGVTMYLEEQQIEQLLQTLQRVFPTHRLICDVMNKEFFDNWGIMLHHKIKDMGTSFVFTPETPEDIFKSQGYKLSKKIPIVESAVLFEAPEIPESVLEDLRQTLPRGYSIYDFERGTDF